MKRKREFFFLGSLIFIFISLILIQPAIGYGTSMGTAQEVTAGSYDETFYASDSHAYYKIYKESGDSLKVDLDVRVTSDLDLYILDTGGQVIASSTNDLNWDEHITHTCTYTGWHYIRVTKVSVLFDIDFGLDIAGDIPSFEFVFASLGILGILLIYWFQRSKLLKTSELSS